MKNVLYQLKHIAFYIQEVLFNEKLRYLKIISFKQTSVYQLYFPLLHDLAWKINSIRMRHISYETVINNFEQDNFLLRGLPQIEAN